MFRIIYPKMRRSSTLSCLSDFCTLDDIWQNPPWLSPVRVPLKNVKLYWKMYSLKYQKSEARSSSGLFIEIGTEWLASLFEILFYVNVPISWRVLPYDFVRKAIYIQISFRENICSFREREKLIPWGALTLMRNKARAQQWCQTRKASAL